MYFVLLCCSACIQGMADIRHANCRSDSDVVVFISNSSADQTYRASDPLHHFIPYHLTPPYPTSSFHPTPHKITLPFTTPHHTILHLPTQRKAVEQGLECLSMRGFIMKYLQAYPELLDLVANDTTSLTSTR